MGAQAESVLEVMDRLGLDKPHLAGYSMGGRLAMYLAQNTQDRFASVALLSATAGIEDEVLRARRKHEDEELASRIERDGLAAFLESWGRHPLLQSTLSDPRGFDALLMDRKGQTAEGLAGSLRGMGQGSQPSLWPGIAHISIPILCVTGELDENYTEIAHRMSAANPKLSVRTLRNAGHDLVSDALQQLHELLREFWSATERS
jgi:2-succinyl-6-hydroxy-2,4-cyclohexadiene-1-carboxylate synthase